MSGPDLNRRTIIAGSILAVSGALPAFAGPASTRQSLTYLLPAPREAIVFAPFVLAEASGRYARAGLDVAFTTVSGGANVARALAGAGTSLGGAVGDTAMLLRSQGVKVCGVALLGQHSFLTLISAKGLLLDAASLRGTAIGVPSRQDTSFYALEALLRQLSVPITAVTIREGSSTDLIGALSRGELQAIVGTVDWGVRAEEAGAVLEYHSLDPFYPALAQAILATDQLIAQKPAVVRAFVRATLNEIWAVSRDPDAAARRYLSAVPSTAMSQRSVARTFRLLAAHVYGRRPGRFDAARMRAAALSAEQLHLLPASADVCASYTNAFVA